MPHIPYLFGSISDLQIIITRLNSKGRIQDRVYQNPTPSSRRRILTYAAQKNFSISSGVLTFSEYSI